jgi:hypothetical protein
MNDIGRSLLEPILSTELIKNRQNYFWYQYGIHSFAVPSLGDQIGRIFALWAIVYFGVVYIFCKLQK